MSTGDAPRTPSGLFDDVEQLLTIVVLIVLMLVTSPLWGPYVAVEYVLHKRRMRRLGYE